ncbi:LuxR C-terminal-related transcriptional regulator [Streptomyces sp. NPDC058701]|uniref:helix-turn-helix transcriptional regulator n=1 Tax=Streptomyces sp. NPDC058701 TaxID=3346608 RepID=UPI0036548378
MDDAHLLSDPLADILAAYMGERRGVVLLAATSEMPLPAPIARTLKEQRLQRVELQPLEPADAQRMARSMLVTDRAAAASPHLAKLSGGNPLLLRELARSDQPAAGGPVSVPSMASLHRTSLDGLAAEQRRALELIALAEPGRLCALERVIGEETLLRLEDLRLIRVSCDSPGAAPGVRTAHPLLPHALRAEVAHLRSRHHLRAYKEALGSAELSDNEISRLVGWSLSVHAECTEAELLRAVAILTERDDLTEALTVTRAGLVRFGTLAAHRALLDTLIALGRNAEVHEHVQAVHATGDADPSGLLWAYRVNASLQAHDHETARAMLPLVPARFERELLTSQLAWCERDYPRCSKVARASLRAAADTTEVVRATVFAMFADCRRGRPLDALKTYRGAVGCIDQRSCPPVVRSSLTSAYASALHLSGSFREAEQVLVAECRRSNLSVKIAAERQVGLGVMSLETGRVRAAVRLFASVAHSPSAQWRNTAQAWMVLAESSLPVPDRTLDPGVVTSIPPAHRTVHTVLAEAVTACGRGDRALALELLGFALAESLEQGAHTDAAIVAHQHARLGLRIPGADLARIEVQGDYLVSRVRFARGCTERSACLVQSAAEGFQRVGAAPAAAEAYAELHRLHQSDGDQRAAARAAAAAQRVLAQCDLLVPAPRQSADSFVPLTERESEIAGMAARGMPDKAIAEALSISVRTVSNTLYRIYAKTGVRDRRRLRRLMGSERPGGY